MPQQNKLHFAGEWDMVTYYVRYEIVREEIES